MPIDAYYTALCLVEPGYETDESGLAASGSPDDRDLLACRHAQVDVLECRLLPSIVGKGDAVQLHGAARTRDRIGPPARLGGRIDRLKDNLPGGDGLLYGAGHTDQFLQRLRDTAQRDEEAHRVILAHAPMKGVQQRNRDHDGPTEGGDLLHDRIRQAAREHEPHEREPVALVDPLELIADLFLRVVDLDEPRSLEALLRDARDVDHRVLNALAVAAEMAIDDGHEPGDHRPDGERNRCQLRVQVEESGDVEDENESCTDHDDDRVRRRLANLLGVESELREHCRGRAAVEIADREP